MDFVKEKRKMNPRWLQNQLFEKMKMQLGKRSKNRSKALELLLIKLLGKKKRSEPAADAIKESERSDQFNKK